MSRLANCFAQLKTQGKKALIPFITAGDPNPDLTVQIMHTMVKAGANIIELGVPFSDPMADGPVIQKASERALEHHVSLRNVLAMVQLFRTGDNETPVVLMGYLNPIEIMGYELFAQEAQKAGVDGVLTVDLPPEEAIDVLPLFIQHNLDPIFLIAPTTNDERISTICNVASGFIYYVSVKGITGAGDVDADDVTSHIEHIRSKTDLPVGVGFGIKDGDSAKRIGASADAVVVGSALVKIIESHQNEEKMLLNKVESFINELSTAIS